MLLRRMTFNKSGMTLFGNKVAVPLQSLSCTVDSVVNTAHIFIITQTAEAALGGGKKSRRDLFVGHLQHRCPNV